MEQASANKQAFMFRLATVIVDRRNLFFLVTVISLIFSAFSRSWVEVENDLTAFLPYDAETKLALDLMDEQFTTCGTAEVMVANITCAEANELSGRLAGLRGVQSVSFDENDDASLESLERVKEALDGYDLYVSTELGNTLQDTIDAEVSVIMVYVAVIVIIVLTLTSQTYGEVLPEDTVSYGGTYYASLYPSIPENEGCCAAWDAPELDCVRFDTVVTAVYTPYTTAVASDSARSGGRAVFLAEGSFEGEGGLSAQPLAKNTDGFAPLSTGLISALRGYLGSAPWYRLIATPINRDVSEQWHITLPQDGSSSCRVHYTAPDGSVKNLRIYVRQGGGWTRADCDTFGSYLTFDVSGSEADIAAVTVLPVWWAWLILLLLAAELLLLVIRLIRRAARRRSRRVNAPHRRRADAAGSFPR